MRQVVFEQTRFLSTVLFCSEFKLENIYSGVNFRGKNVCGNFYSGNLFLRVARRIANIEKLEPARISCHTVGRYIASLCNAAMLTVRRAINLICIFLSCGFYAIVIFSLINHYFVVEFHQRLLGASSWMN